MKSYFYRSALTDKLRAVLSLFLINIKLIK